MIVDFPGMPTEYGEKIEFPHDIELLREPMFSNAPVDYVMKHGSELQKYIISKTPLRNNTRYAYVSCVVRYVYPGIIINKIILPHLGSQRNEWHPDGLYDPKRKVHAIANFLPTEFNANPFSIDVPDGLGNNGIIEFLYKQQPDIQAQSSLAGHIITYDDHIHRAPIPQERGVRFFFRIQETDVDFQVPQERWKSSGSDVWIGTKQIPNVRQNEDRVMINFGA